MDERNTGSILDGKYEVLDRLGSGGMGDIYLVRHLHLEQKRILKILRRELAEDTDAQKRFLREARLATDLKHPNVAILYDYARLEDGHFYTAWEYIDGEDVGRWLADKGCFPIPLALQLGIQALRGLEAIHTAGVVHRDVSPDNLMITRDRRGRHLLKIIDLGLAKALTPDPKLEVTQAGTFMGKLRYCSPEQAGALKGEGLDRRSDLYSFGLVLYEMITGQSPFDAENAPGSVFKRLTEEPLPMVGRNPEVEVPSELDLVVRRSLARDRDDRYGDAIAFIEALEPLLEGFGGRPNTAAPAPKSAESATRRSGSLISKQEREDLLAQIDRAARRMKQTTRMLGEAEEAARDGKVEEARRIAQELEASHPRASGLVELKELLAEVDPSRIPPPRPPSGPPIPTPPTPTSEAAPQPPESEKLPEAESLPDFAPGEAPTGKAPTGEAPAEEPPPPAVTEAAAPSEELPEIPLSEPELTPLDPSETAPLEDSRVLQTVQDEPEEEDEAEAAPESPEEEEPAGMSPEEAVREAEAMVERYLKERKTKLATLALDALLELQPEHPRRKDFQDWVRLIKEEEQQGERAQKALEAGREALAQGNVKGARKQLELVARHDPTGELADQLQAEIDELSTRQSQTEEFATHSVQFEAALADGDVDKADEIYRQLTDLGVAKVTLTLYEKRLATERSRQRDLEVVEPFEQRIDARLEAEDWKGAREVVRELSEALPESPLPAQLLDRVDRREQLAQRQRSVIYGAQQVQEFIAAGEAEKAGLALRILRQMDPENPDWISLEERVASLRSS
ncbi:MAG: serine/threonine-protein kinase [Acidobacteriota bacterium]|nr:serine/threonine-protein kinase [Acidobacteriota bacterium]